MFSATFFFFSSLFLFWDLQITNYGKLQLWLRCWQSNNYTSLLLFLVKSNEVWDEAVTGTAVRVVAVWEARAEVAAHPCNGQFPPNYWQLLPIHRALLTELTSLLQDLTDCVHTLTVRQIRKSPLNILNILGSSSHKITFGTALLLPTFQLSSTCLSLMTRSHRCNRSSTTLLYKLQQRRWRDVNALAKERWM